MLEDNAGVAGHFVGDRLRAAAGPDLDDLADLGHGEGRVTTMGGRAVAVCCDDDGDRRAVDARCSHLGCLVEWNGAERSWDCPCHGSRFEVDGAVITGPAVRLLRRVELEGEPDGGAVGA